MPPLSLETGSGKKFPGVQALLQVPLDLLQVRLRVISRQSVVRFKGTGKSVAEIASELKVDTVVEGSALLAGTRVRFTAQLSVTRQPSGRSIITAGAAMRVEQFSFGSIRIDGVTYEHDVVIEGGVVRKRKKKASKEFREAFGHTPLSLQEDIPWKCRRLVIGTGAHDAMPVMEEVKLEAEKRGIELLVLPTPEAIRVLNRGISETNAILHVTC